MPQGQATSREDAERLITVYQSSGLTRQQFCTTHNIKVGTFHWWMKRHNDAQQKNVSDKPPFVQVTPLPKVFERVESDLTIDLPSGARLKWRGSVLPPSLTVLLETLGRDAVR